LGPGLAAAAGRIADEKLLPITGVLQARKVLDKDLPTNTLLRADQPGPSAVD
jgi:hypothetical protein